MANRSLTEAETACQKWGDSVFMKWGVIYIHSEYIGYRLLVFNVLHDNLQFWGGSSRPCPPASGYGLAMVTLSVGNPLVSVIVTASQVPLVCPGNHLSHTVAIYYSFM